MKIFNCHQGSQEWHDLRSGLLTASKLHRALTSRGEISVSLEGLIETLADERLGIFSEPVSSYAIERGKDLEAEAREEFELWYGCKVQQVGFCLHDSGLIGCSPDGLLQEIRAGLEIKCPLEHTFLKLRGQESVPGVYVMQVQGCMYVTGYRSWYLWIYHPDHDPVIYEVKYNLNLGQKIEEVAKTIEAKLEDLGLPRKEIS